LPSAGPFLHMLENSLSELTRFELWISRLIGCFAETSFSLRAAFFAPVSRPPLAKEVPYHALIVRFQVFFSCHACNPPFWPIPSAFRARFGFSFRIVALTSLHFPLSPVSALLFSQRLDEVTQTLFADKFPWLPPSFFRVI